MSLITVVVSAASYTPVEAQDLSELPTLPPSQGASQGASTDDPLPLPASTSDDASAWENYRLGPGDALRLEVFNAEDYSGDFTVLSGGALNLPLVGAVAIEGLTLQEASSRIEQQLRTYVRQPRVTLSLVAARPVQVAIAGQVNRPGAYSLSPAEDGVPTLTEMIELAGGITQTADIRQITVSRQQGATAQQVPIDLWQLLREGNLAVDLALQDGDRVFIPAATALSPEETAELATASFSPDQMTVNVVGEVEQPGTLQVPPNTPLNQAILAAGGFNNRARTGTVSLVRLNPNGTVTQRELSVDFASGISEEQNPSLRPYDTVIVERSGLTRTTDAIGSILSPLNGLFGLFRLLGGF